MPMLFWLPAIIVSEMWNIVLGEMPFAAARARAIPDPVSEAQRGRRGQA